MPKNAKDARIFIKFAEDGTRADTRIEDANLYIIPPQPIIELRNGEEILRVIPAHYEDDPEQGTILVPEQRIPTGQYEQVELLAIQKKYWLIPLLKMVPIFRLTLQITLR